MRDLVDLDNRGQAAPLWIVVSFLLNAPLKKKVELFDSSGRLVAFIVVVSDINWEVFILGLSDNQEGEIVHCR